MHQSVMQWVTDQVAANQLAHRRTLEVGSMVVNGTVRDLFAGEYTGLDIEPGVGVDVIANAHYMPFGDGDYAVVVSTEMLEHDDRPDLTLAEIHRVLAFGGLFLLTARGPGFPYHGFPADHYRYTVATIIEGLYAAGFDVDEAHDDPEFPGVFALAVRGDGTPDREALDVWRAALVQVSPT